MGGLGRKNCVDDFGRMSRFDKTHRFPDVKMLFSLHFFIAVSSFLSRTFGAAAGSRGGKNCADDSGGRVGLIKRTFFLDAFFFVRCKNAILSIFFYRNILFSPYIKNWRLDSGVVYSQSPREVFETIMEKLNDIKSVCDLLQIDTASLTRAVEEYNDSIRQLQLRLRTISERVPACIQMTVRIDEESLILDRT